jgi:hypothetical protein
MYESNEFDFDYVFDEEQHIKFLTEAVEVDEDEDDGTVKVTAAEQKGTSTRSIHLSKLIFSLTRVLPF